MAGIYIHIPFCKQACSYCDFHFSTNLSRKQDFVSALLKEIDQRSAYVETEIIDTIYFGGGTPSLLNSGELNQIFDKIERTFSINSAAEITLEANPDDLTIDKLTELKKSPINRLSIGVQSFHEKDLLFMNRAHSANEALSSIKCAQDKGFSNISIDLIFGGQTTTNEMWLSNLEQFFELNTPHLSSYSLTIEEKTALAHQVNKGLIPSPDDEKNYQQYLILQEEIDRHGFEQYELSNYCKDGLTSKHNTSYWLGKNYLGIGPSAHSFNGNSRQWNVKNNSKYIKALNDKSSFFEQENLSEIDRYHELLITSLRTKWGLNINELANSYSPHIASHFKKKVEKLNKSMVLLSEEKLVIKRAFLFQADEVVRELMIDFL